MSWLSCSRRSDMREETVAGHETEEQKCRASQCATCQLDRLLCAIAAFDSHALVEWAGQEALVIRLAPDLGLIW